MTKRGTSAEYIVRRLKRDAPEIAADPTTTALANVGAPVGNTNRRKAHELAADPTIAAIAAVAEPAGNNVANGTFVSRGSTSAEYLVRRLKRDAPEIAADSTVTPWNGEQGSIATLKPGRGAEYLVRRTP